MIDCLWVVSSSCVSSHEWKTGWMNGVLKFRVFSSNEFWKNESVCKYILFFFSPYSLSGKEFKPVVKRKGENSNMKFGYGWNMKSTLWINCLHERVHRKHFVQVSGISEELSRLHRSCEGVSTMKDIQYFMFDRCSIYSFPCQNIKYNVSVYSFHLIL